MHRTIPIAGVCFVNHRGELLTVRKKSTAKFMLPGGKLEAGESFLETAAREVHEELGIDISTDDLTQLGAWEAEAANEPATIVKSTVFYGTLSAVPEIAAEIEELRWTPLATALQRTDLAPLLTGFVVPALLEFPLCTC